MPRFSVRGGVLGLALALGLVAVDSAPVAAAVVYDFSLPANGEVGAVRVVLTLPRFITPGDNLAFVPLDASLVTVTSDEDIDRSFSLIALNAKPGTTLFGIALVEVQGDLLLYTEKYPDDFFAFVRTPTQTGTFTSVSGLVGTDDDELDTRTPTATLVVSGTVPEPTSVALLGVGALGLLARRRRQARRD
jgi:hypothetical protein